ncbi:MAG TPA: pyridoxamine 5'-phosphate oxidase family protein [Solirubrobacteraceae bacterium]|nr:pyridoxamine 5'-phosphate oxidase family protein [Solirubrobacteraceae bacterium]
MGEVLERIDDHLAGWIARQPMFFVASAPLSADGHVNVSPKGPIGTLKVLGEHRVAYLDYFGSGAETVAHLRENGRIVVMLCAFEGPPRIVRLHGTGEAIMAGDPRFAALEAECAFADGLTDVNEAKRAIVVVEVERISKSCGYGVPLMEQTGEREHFDLSKRKRLRTMGPEAMVASMAERNATSIDGLPAVPAPAP